MKKNLISGLLIGIAGIFCLSSCANTDTKTSSAQEHRQSQSSSAQNTPEYWLDIDAYRDTLSDARVSLADYRKQYESDTASLTDAEYENLDFSDSGSCI